MVLPAVVTPCPDACVALCLDCNFDVAGSQDRGNTYEKDQKTFQQQAGEKAAFIGTLGAKTLGPCFARLQDGFPRGIKHWRVVACS